MLKKYDNIYFTAFCVIQKYFHSYIVPGVK